MRPAICERRPECEGAARLKPDARRFRACWSCRNTPSQIEDALRVLLAAAIAERRFVSGESQVRGSPRPSEYSAAGLKKIYKVELALLAVIDADQARSLGDQACAASRGVIDVFDDLRGDLSGKIRANPSDQCRRMTVRACTTNGDAGRGSTWARTCLRNCEVGRRRSAHEHVRS
jgi:hypothetical protein